MKKNPNDTSASAPQAVGGLQAVAQFLETAVPPAEQERAADVLMKILNGSLWELWQLARARANLPSLENNAQNAQFLQLSLNALSDTFIYGAPLTLQLDSFDEVKASVFQIARAPGKNIVYLGALCLVLGVFAMLYIRERRVWVWLKPTFAAQAQMEEGANEPLTTGCAITLAASTTRMTLDFEKEFAALSQDLVQI